ncbi:MAG: energy-coupling factor transporter ATPase [Firmicutes bacterium]|nr:energy-coupling factor transporter ATPase [Bacillota bacterium]
MKIALDRLSHTYSAGTTLAAAALEDISLSVEAGEIVGVIGPTGSGKSTLVQHLNGLLLPTSGKVGIDGVDLGSASRSEMRLIRQKVGLVFQFPEQQLFEETVYEDVAFGPRNLGIAEPELEQRVRRAMQDVGLDFDRLARRSPFGLSSGQMRRVAIAGVLAMQPEVLVLDEPTAGLDPAGRHGFLRLVRELRERLNLTVIIVSHHTEEIYQLVDRVIVLHQGRLFMDGPVREVFARVEELTSIGMGVPVVTEVLHGLQRRGWPPGETVVTMERAVDWISRKIKELGVEAGKPLVE